MSAVLAGPPAVRSLGRPARRRVALAAAAVACTVAAWLAVHSSAGSAVGTSTTAGLPRTTPFSLPAVVPGAAPVTLAAAGGRPVLLSFFASWCDSCRLELRAMAGVARQADRRVAVIGVDVNDDAAAAAALLGGDHLGYPVGADRGGAVAAAYGLVGLPTTVVLDAGHRVVGEVVGPLTPALATSWLARLGR